MIHRFVDLQVGVVAYMRLIFDGTNSYDQTWAVPSAGGTPIQLTFRTTDGDQDISPCVSPDGTKVAYVSGTGFANYKLRIVNADGSGDALLDNNTPCASPTWHPDGSKILYRRGNGFRTVEPDGSNNTAITPSPAPTVGFTLRAPIYNFDGSLISFSVDDNLSGVLNTLWVMNADGSGAASISTTRNTGATISSWSPIANRVAFLKANGANTDLVACDEDGSNVTTIKATIVGGMERMAWTPDGTAVMYAHNTPATGTVFAGEADGSGSNALSPTLQRHNAGHSGPFVFGDRVYVVRLTTQDLVSVALDGSDLRVEDTPDLVGPDFLDLRFLDAGGTDV